MGVVMVPHYVLGKVGAYVLYNTTISLFISDRESNSIAATTLFVNLEEEEALLDKW